MQNKILYIDGYNFFYRMYQKNSAKDSNGDPIGGFVGSVNALQKLVQKFMPSEIYYIFDGIDAGRRRRTMFSGYKDKRGKTDRTTAVKLNDELTEFVNNEQYQIQLLFSCLQQLPIKLIAVDSFEADDIIAYLVEKNQDSLNIIASTDKDYLQLINDNTYVWSAQQEVLYTSDQVVEKFDIIPQNFAYMRSILGDPSDKLKGVKGVGRESLFELLPSIKVVQYETFWDFFKAIEELPETKSKTLQKLKEGKKQAKLMYDLMQLKEIDLTLRASDSLTHQMLIQANKSFSKFNFKVYCMKNNLQSILKNYEIWIRPFVTINNLHNE